MIEKHFEFTSHLFEEIKYVEWQLFMYVLLFVCEVGIEVSCEDLYSGRHWRVCQAFATFVAKRTDANKV